LRRGCSEENDYFLSINKFRAAMTWPCIVLKMRHSERIGSCVDAPGWPLFFDYKLGKGLFSARFWIKRIPQSSTSHWNGAGMGVEQQ
jgi:hypothetical protein